MAFSFTTGRNQKQSERGLVLRGRNDPLLVLSIGP